MAAPSRPYTCIAPFDTMRIDLVYPTLPPALNGIGDYTAHMAQALAQQGADVRILTEKRTDLHLPGVDIVPAFTVNPRSGVRALVDAVEAHPPDWLVLQFEQFSYGRWGLNPYLPLALRSIRRAVPRTRIALMAHEDYPSVSEGLKLTLMSLWQRPQFWALGRLSDRVFLSIESWAAKYQSWFPHARVEHLPVGSNMPRLPLTSLEARTRLDLPPDAFLVGLFGSAHPSRQLDRVAATLSHLRSLHPGVEALYVGGSGPAVRAALPTDVPLHDLGPCSAEDVSAAFTAMDLYLSPFRHGVSTRRGSFLVGIQHGVPTLSTSGPETDGLLRAADSEAFRLVPWTDADAFRAAAERLAFDEADRTRMGQAAGDFFDATFAWPRLASRLLTSLASSTTSSDPEQADQSTRQIASASPTPTPSAASK